jgi:hypothetical protein
MISVLTPTVRPELVEINRKSLEKQDFKDFEWIIGTPFPEKFKHIKDAVIVKDPPKRDGDFWVLNRAYNEMLKKAKGELIVSYQDGIYCDSDALSTFWFWYKEKGPKWCVTGSGNIYSKLDDFGKPVVQVWSDPRRAAIPKEGQVYEVYPVDWEINFASAPKQAFYDIGGFDEELDRLGFGMDNVSVCDRLDAAGYKFWIDHGLECRGLKHGRLPDWDKYHNMHGNYEKRKNELIDKGIWPKLSYL